MNFASMKQSEDPESTSAQMFSWIGTDLLVRVGVSDNGETGGGKLSDRGETEGGNGVSNRGENRPSEEMELDEEENKLSGETESEDGENQPFEKGENEMEMKREEVSERVDAFKHIALSARGRSSQPPVCAESTGLQTSFLSPKRRLSWRSWWLWPWMHERRIWGSL